ncbi:MAG TPA: penicillin acylase family protein, partial [Paracoccaceae bacterium]|nr:penicillin acylase family protein [Paracoccaceae bacterium]
DLPLAVNPSREDPSSGILVNTNNKTTDAAFPEHISFDWGDTQRLARATHLLNARQFHTRDSFIEIQTDVVSNAARLLLPMMAKDLWWAGQPAATGSYERRRQQALELLANWNGEMGEHDPEPLIYAAWISAFQRRLIIDELGLLATQFPTVRVEFLERVLRDKDGASIWCDIRNTTKKETCQDISAAALDEAMLSLSEAYGDTVTRWRWGYAHQALHESKVLGKIPVVGWFANIRQETPGGDNTLRRGNLRATGAQPFTNIHGSGYRAVYDFADPDSSVYIIATGQSGHLLSRHYDDLATIWRRGEYIPMSLDPTLARGGAVGITHLRPDTAN